MAESAGAQVLEELALDRELARRAADAGLTFGPDQIEAERRLLIETLIEAAARASPAPPDDADGERLLTQVRRSRGLGERRFQSLLWRNAALRAIVRGQAETPAITPEDLTQAFAMRHGPKARIRLIVVPTASQAAEVRGAVTVADPNSAPSAPALPPSRPAPAALLAFAEAAFTRSIDPSRVRGGLLDPISPADPGYPVAIRRAVELLEPGQISPPIAVSWPAASPQASLQITEGFALVYLQERLPADGVTLEAAAPALEREIRTVRERARMERLARDILPAATSRLVIFDLSLSRAWEERAVR